jgi:hypothetical protein
MIENWNNNLCAKMLQAYLKRCLFLNGFAYALHRYYDKFWHKLHCANLYKRLKCRLGVQINRMVDKIEKGALKCKKKKTMPVEEEI